MFHLFIVSSNLCSYCAVCSGSSHFKRLWKWDLIVSLKNYSFPHIYWKTPFLEILFWVFFRTNVESQQRILTRVFLQFAFSWFSSISEVCLVTPNSALHTYTRTLNCYYLVTKLQVPFHLVTHLWDTYPSEADYTYQINTCSKLWHPSVTSLCKSSSNC